MSFAVSYQAVTVAAGQTTSTTIDCTRYQLAAVTTPAAMDSTGMQLEASFDGSIWHAVKEVGGAASYSLTVSASQSIGVDPRITAGVQYLRLVCGSTESASRVFYCHMRTFA